MFFSKKNNGLKIIEAAPSLFDSSTEAVEGQFQDDLVTVTKMVQDDDGYSTNKKLEIYDTISQISNCKKSEWAKYSKKLMKLLK